MICKCCKKEFLSKEKVKMKNGVICRDCFDKLPRPFQNSIRKIRTEELKEALTYLKPCQAKYWATYNDTIRICNTSLQISNYEIDLKDLESVRLNFHPFRSAEGVHKVYGVMTIVMTFKKIKLRLEEALMLTTVGYRIVGDNISYTYPEKFVEHFSCIQQYLEDDSHTTYQYWEKKHNERLQREREEKRRKEKEKLQAERERQKDEAWRAEELRKQKEKERAEAEKKRAEQERKRREEQRKREESEWFWRQRQKAYEQARREQTQRQNESEFERARIYFGFAPNASFTKKDLDKKKREFAKKLHPDNGGSEEKMANMMHYYDVLAFFAD